MILILICERLVSDWVIRIAVFCMEKNFILRKRVLYFIYNVRKPVQNCIWLGLWIKSKSIIYLTKSKPESWLSWTIQMEPLSAEEKVEGTFAVIAMFLAMSWPLSRHHGRRSLSPSFFILFFMARNGSS